MLLASGFDLPRCSVELTADLFGFFKRVTMACNKKCDSDWFRWNPEYKLFFVF